MWHLADKPLISRLLLGTAGYPSLEVMADAVRASKTEVITVSLKRQMSRGEGANCFGKPSSL